MRTLAIALSLALLLPVYARGASQVLSLASVAAQNGYAMRWLGPERSISLTRPGTEIVLRPGVVMYDVNAHVEVADVPPVATRTGDVLISSWLAGRLRALARSSSSAVSRPSGTANEAAGGAAQQPLQGSIVLHARQLDDEQALAVGGQAAPNVPVTITLLATLAPDLPTVILSRHDVQSDVSGNFEAVITVGADYLPDTLLTVLATSVPDIAPASTYLRLKSPNAGVSVPLERRHGAR